MTRTDDAHKLPGHIVEAELVQCPRCGCSVLSLDVVHWCEPTNFSVKRSRDQVRELRNAVEREITTLREQAKLPWQQQAIGWLDVAVDGLNGAELVLGWAELELARKDGR